MDEKILIEAVNKLTLEPGDILHIKVGGDLHVNGDASTWVPAQEHLEEMRALWESVVPDGTYVIVTHHLVEDIAVQSKIRMSSWPPKAAK